MNPDVADFAQVAVIIVVMVASLATISVGTFFAIRRGMRLSRPRADDQRLEHLQQSVDAIAIEVERITEAQRFTAKVLAERTNGSPDSAIGAHLGEPQRSAKR